MRSTKLLAIVLLAFVASVETAPAQQPAYPNRPITWVVPTGAGGVMDNSARVYAKVLSEKLGQPIIVENKPGAGGIIGTEAVAQAKPDGYTMLYAVQSTMATFPFLYKKLSYSPLKTFVPVNGLGDSSMLMVVNASAPYKTVEELIAYMKKNPGKVNYGAFGIGTATHLLGEMFQAATGTSMVQVNYKTPANLYADLMSGTIDVIFDFTVVMRPHIEAGKLRALAISRDNRLKSFPDVPTFKELGLDVVLTVWASVVMPAGTPPEIVAKMSAAIAETTRDPAIVKYSAENDFSTLGQLGPEQLKAFYGSEAEKFRRIVERANISLD
jgi:tripartite-type tricarboxylate transporter receptor subunit TctC